MGPMLEEFAWKNGRECPGKIRGRRKQKRPSEVEVPSWNGGGYAKTRDTENKKWEKVVGEKFLFVVESTTCRRCNVSKRSQRKKKR